MMIQDEKKQETPGRKFDQPSTGSNSAGSMGSGGTGDSGSMQGADDGTQQSAGRTDDLLSGGSETDEESEGFTGGQGNRQAAGPAGSRAKRPDDK